MTRYGDTINEQAVRILLECILVHNFLPKLFPQWESGYERHGDLMLFTIA